MSDALHGLSRRGFVFGISAAAGGLVLPPIASAQAPSETSGVAPELTAWIAIGADDSVVIRVARSEMGQGIYTALPMLVAEELDCAWSHVRPEYASVAEHLARGRVWGSMVTTDSVSVRGSHEYLRKAGAQARAMLIAEAASRWGCGVEECATKDSVVTHAASSRALRYGQLAAAASRRPVPHEVVLKRPQDWRLIGTAVAPFDMMDKVTGRVLYAIDVRLPGMLYAAVRACPTHGGKLASHDASKAMAMPGVRHVATVGDDAVAVVADRWWQAKLALDALPLTWDETRGAGLSTEVIAKVLHDGLSSTDVAIGRRLGDADEALVQAARQVTAEYLVPYLAHATMEPQTCTALVTADRAEVWAPTQNGEGTLSAVATALELDPAKVVVHKCHLGGGFGRRGLSQDWARQAALIARAVGGVPVKMIWSRPEDITHDHYRPMVAARLTAGFDREGRLTAWRVRVCGASIAAKLAPQWLRDGRDVGMMNGFLERDMFYGVANLDVSAVMRNNAIPVGFWRGVNYSQNSFFREAFVDEMAHAVGQDPYHFRRGLLAHAPRTLAVLDEAARRADWGHAPAGIYQGIAVVEFDDAVCAQVVELSVSAEGEVKVHRVVCVVDTGHVVHADTIVAQMEGCIVQGLGAALAGEITVTEGRVDQSNFHDYPLLRISETPRIETHLKPSGERYGPRWGGVGETGLPPLAPALVNAVFAATGQRVRTLPLKRHALRPA